MAWFDQDREAFEASRQESYEASVVRHILRNMSGVTEADVKFYQRGIDGTEQLTIAALLNACEFPLTLMTRKLPEITPGIWLDLNNRLTKSKIYEVYSEAAIEHPEAHAAGCLGIVFAWPKWTQFMLFHNFNTVRYDQGQRTIWYVGPQRKLLVLETLDSFMLATGIRRVKKRDGGTA